MAFMGTPSMRSPPPGIGSMMMLRTSGALGLMDATSNVCAVARVQNARAIAWPLDDAAERALANADGRRVAAHTGRGNHERVIARRQPRYLKVHLIQNGESRS